MLGKIRLRGFTMIELLVVIAVIGILAVALLATLNPLEQIRKGRDTRTRSDSSQLVGALERYNASLGYFPWQSGESDEVVANTADVPFLNIKTGTLPAGAGTYQGVALATRLDALTATSEVKASFIDRITGNAARDMYLYYNDEPAGPAVEVCFTPESSSFQKEALDRCATGDWSTDFTSTTGISAFCTTLGSCPCPQAATQASYPTTFTGGTGEMICLP